jgi:hypothetical protein
MLSAIPAVDLDVTIAQLFNGTITEVIDVFGRKNERRFIQALQDNVRKR